MWGLGSYWWWTTNAWLIALVISRGALGTLFPAAVARIYPKEKIKALARNQTWRDVGAAVVPLAAGVRLAFIGPELMHIIVAFAFYFCGHNVCPVSGVGFDYSICKLNSYCR